jgi:hypothetical protein
MIINEALDSYAFELGVALRGNFWPGKSLPNRNIKIMPKKSWTFSGKRDRLLLPIVEREAHGDICCWTDSPNSFDVYCKQLLERMT